MNKLFNFIDAAFYINLDSRVDKKEILTKHFQELGIESFVQRRKALEPQDLGLGYTIQPETGKYLHEAYSKACLYTHVEIVKWAKEQKLSNVLIFEYDVKFYTSGDYNPLECIQTAINELKANIPEWELFYLGTNPGGRSTEFDLVRPHVVRLEEAIGTHAVLINSKIFDTIINEYTGHHAFDLYLSGRYSKKYSAYPMCACQRCGVPNDIAIVPYGGLNEEFWLSMYNKKINKLYTE